MVTLWLNLTVTILSADTSLKEKLDALLWERLNTTIFVASVLPENHRPEVSPKSTVSRRWEQGTTTRLYGQRKATHEYECDVVAKMVYGMQPEIYRL